jgi:hypothetical protein
MDADRFELWLRSLSSSPSRRIVVRLLAGSASAGLLRLGLQSGEAKKGGKGKGKGKKKRRKKIPPPPPLVPVLLYQCSGPKDSTIVTGSPATARFSQTFLARQSGSLLQIQFEVQKDAASTGDYLVELLAVAVANDEPTNTVLAQAIVLNTVVPVGFTVLVTATFAGPPLVAGTQYAAAISRPGGSQLAVSNRNGNACGGIRFSQSPSGQGVFIGNLLGDFVSAVTVLA